MQLHGPCGWFALTSAVLLLVCSFAAASSLDEALAYSSKHAAAADDDLIALASFPSISSLPEHAGDARAAAQWLEKKLKRIGLQVNKDYRCRELPISCCSLVLLLWSSSLKRSSGTLRTGSQPTCCCSSNRLHAHPSGTTQKLRGGMRRGFICFRRR